MDLSVTLGEAHPLVLKNPVLAASGTFGSGLEFEPFGDLAALGGIAVKGISLLPSVGNPEPRIAETAAGMLNAIGLQNNGVEHFLKNTLPLLPWRKTAIIANIYAASIEDFASLASRLAETEGVAALEINISCPNVAAGGAQFGASATACAEVVRTVRASAPEKHIIVKLSPNVASIAEIAKAAEGEGADSISCINTLLGMAINAKTRKPMLANIVGGLSGPAIKPVALRCVWQVANAVRIPVIGIGGIASTTDIIEFLLAGASAVQVGTATFMSPDACFRLAARLPEALAEHGANSVCELVGALRLDEAPCR